MNALATHTALSAYAVLGNVLALLILASALFLFARYVGRGPFVALLLSFYAGYAIYAAFPYLAFLPSAPALTAVLSHAAVYFGLVLVFYIILRRVVVSDFLYIGLFGHIILATLGAAFLIALAYHVFSVTDVYHFTPTIAQLFAPTQYFFYWFAAPAIGLFFFAR